LNTILKSVFIIAIAAVAMIGVMVPSVFAIFPDPEKDPKEYVIRYYTESDYQKWFDTNFPNDSIEDKVGYPYKIVTDEYYVNSLFDVAIKVPTNVRVVESEKTVTGDSRSLVQFYFDDYDPFSPDGDYIGISTFNIHYSQRNVNDINYDNLLHFYSNYPYSGSPYKQQTRIIDQSLKENDNGMYEVRYNYVQISAYPEDHSNSYLAGKASTQQVSMVFFLYPNGDQYIFVFVTPPSLYSTTVKIFNESLDSFYSGKVKTLSSITSTGISNTPTFTKSSEPEPVVEYIPKPPVEVASTSNCGTGTESVNGVCQVIQTEEKSSSGGGCLIATATYGSEMALEVQQLRELRDNTLLNTESGTVFMGAFNDIYYSFSPIIADYERENPLFKEAVKLAITPMISTLSLMENAESESEVLGIGISVIMLNIGMYLGIPAILIVGIRKIR